MVLSNVCDSASFQSYASFELSGGNGAESSTAIGQVCKFDEDHQLVAVFGGVRMRRMKQRIVEHLVRRVSAEHVPSELSSAVPLLTPKSEFNKSSNDQHLFYISD